MKLKSVKAWAVWNTELNCPCVEIGENGESIGSAIFSCDTYRAKQRATEWMNTQFDTRAKKTLGIRLKRITITL